MSQNTVTPFECTQKHEALEKLICSRVGSVKWAIGIWTFVAVIAFGAVFTIAMAASNRALTVEAKADMQNDRLERIETKLDRLLEVKR
jgi:hypothetical protein